MENRENFLEKQILIFKTMTETKKIQRVSYTTALKTFQFQNSIGIPITSFTPEANLYRNMMREKIDRMFDSAAKLFSKDQDAAWALNRKARAEWHEIIKTANSL